jgi:predicted anti-sigma-YlaC factor YlaD
MTKNGLGEMHVKMLLGAYVLRGLRGHQEARVRAHLTRCARCRAEYEELAELPMLLDMITGEEAAEAEGPAAQTDALDGDAGLSAP